jgi:acyl-CoA thioesterase I
MGESALTSAIRDIRVCFAGDSYVAGVGDASGLGWVGRLTAHAHACGLPVTAYNLGIRGNTSCDVAARLPDEVSRRLHPVAELRVVLAYGLNDVALDNGRPRVDTARSLGATSRSLDWLASVRVPAVFVGPPAIGTAAQDSRTEYLDRMLAARVAAHKVTYISTFKSLAGNLKWLDGVREGDGAHPGTAGYEQYFEAVRNPLLRFLAQEQ